MAKMTRSQAVASVELKRISGILSAAEADTALKHISRIASGTVYGSRIGWRQQQSLYAIWA
jgi:hypothetical protein